MMIILLIALVINFQLYSFDFNDNSIIFNNNRIANFSEIYFSKNKANIIYSQAIKGNAPQLFVITNNGKKQITNDNFYRYNPVINDQGDIAYTSYNFDDGSCPVYLNNNLLPETNNHLFYKNLEINESYLAFTCDGPDDNTNYLCIYNLSSRYFNNVYVNGYVQKIIFLSTNKLLLQIYCLSSHSMDIYIYDIINNKLSNPFTSANDEIIKVVDYNKNYTVDIITGDNNSKLLFNAYYDIYNYGLASPMSLVNNFTGAQSWGQSYRNLGLIKLYEKTQDPWIKVQLNNIAKNILAVNNKSLGISDANNPDFSWSTKIYSIDKQTPLSLLVNDATIIYPLLLALNNGLIDNFFVRTKLVGIGISMFNYYESYFNHNENVYHIQKGIAFWGDGLWCPYNWQNSFGLALLELYRATGDTKYRDRALILARQFKSEFVYTQDNRLLWHYWPSQYYKGWTSAQNISVNTPHQGPSQDIYYEDLSHAGWNLMFILAIQNYFPNEIFSPQEFAILRNTIDKFIIDGDKFTVHMSGDTFYAPPKFRYLPRACGWCELNYDKFNKFFINIFPKLGSTLGGESLMGYLYTINTMNSSDMIVVESTKFGINGNILSITRKRYSNAEICNYFNIRKDVSFLYLLL